MMELLFATNNRNKLREVSEIMPAGIKVLSLAQMDIHEDIPETSPTIEGNALQKARYVHAITGGNCFADDTGLEVEALGGEPGVRSARYATDGHDDVANIKLLLKNLDGKENRKARFRTVVALILDEKEYLFEGIIEGTIASTPKGEGGFGYDPLFVPDGYYESFAQMSELQKNNISHRGRAIRKLVDFLSGSVQD